MTDDLSTKAREAAENLRTEAHKTRCFVGLNKLPDPFPRFIRRSGENMDKAADLLDQLIEEVARLDHLHKLDHALADQWHERAEKAEAERDRLLDANADLRFRFPDSQRPDGPKALAQAERERDLAVEGQLRCEGGTE